MEDVRAAAGRAGDLVRQILTLSRQGHTERQPITLQPVIREAFNLLRSTIPTTIEMELSTDGECGAVLADGTQIHQVLMNLCTNAYHAMREDGGTIKVGYGSLNVDSDLVRVHPRLHVGEYVCLTASDTGPGIEPAVLERIFEPFFTTKEVGEGTGLGLSVVQGIVLSHGGEITMESVLGKGTTFSVYLPVAGTEPVAQEASDIATLEGDERVLVVDDEEYITRMASRLLKRLGYKVRSVNDGRKALSLFQADPGAFDAVISDQTMPGMTGVQLFQELRLLNSTLPFLLVTGYNEGAVADKVEAGTHCEVLRKPLGLENLGSGLRRILSRGRPCAAAAT